MNMKSSNGCSTAHRPLRVVLIALLGTALITGTAAAVPVQPTYRIVELPLLPDSEFADAYDISDAGQIVGTAVGGGTPGSYSYGISWSASSYAPQRLPDLPDSETAAMAVNDAGFVVGRAVSDFDSNTYVAVMWDPSGAIVSLGDLPREPLASWAYDINAFGKAVGYSVVEFRRGVYGKILPVFWTAPGAIHRLQFVFSPLLGGQAQALNDFGDIAGYFEASPDVLHAMRWPAGQRQGQDLGDLPGGNDQSYAYGINNAGQVVGYGYSDLGKRAVLWESDGSMTDLGDISGSHGSVANDINQVGTIVGTFEAPSFRQGFLWTAADGMLDLYDLIDPADPLRAQFGAGNVTINAINATGLIVGSMTFDTPYGRPIVLVPQED